MDDRFPPSQPNRNPIAQSDDRAPRTWPYVTLVVPHAAADDVAAACFDAGSCGVHVEDSVEVARLAVYFESAQSPQLLAQQLTGQLLASGMWPDGAQVVPGQVEAEQDWNEAWKAFYRPVQATDRIIVHPPWIPVQADPNGLAIAIDPAMAFGTGGHESTQLALRAIEATPVQGSRCLDIGAGSGILSIALIQLGAAHVTAVDIDPVVVDNAQHNLRENLGHDVARTVLRTGSIEVVAGETFDVIVANLESHLVRPLLAGVVQALTRDGVVLLSGYVESERERVLQWLGEAGLTVDETWSLNNWFGCRARVEV